MTYARLLRRRSPLILSANEWRGRSIRRMTSGRLQKCRWNCSSPSSNVSFSIDKAYNFMTDSLDWTHPTFIARKTTLLHHPRRNSSFNRTLWIWIQITLVSTHHTTSVMASRRLHRAASQPFPCTHISTLASQLSSPSYPQAVNRHGSTPSNSAAEHI